MKRNYLFLLLMIFLASCGSSTDKDAQSSTPTPSSPIDGHWEGAGSTSSGRSFTVEVDVQNEHLAGILYSFTGTDGVPCTEIDFAQIKPENQPAISDNKLSASLNDDLAATATFADSNTASGTLTIHWHNRQPRCNGDYEVTWTASKQVAQVTQANTSSNPNAPSGLAVFIQILVFGLSNGAVLALNAIGVTLIYSTVRTLNLAHGDVFALTTALVTSIVNAVGIQKNWPPLLLIGSLFLVFLAALSLGALLSVGVERFGFAPFRGTSKLAPLIATLGISFILFQGALVWRTFQHSWIPGEHRSVPGLPEVPTDGIPSFLPEINLVKALGLPFNLIIRFSDVFVVLVALLLVFLANWVMQKTRTGRSIRAVSQNQNMAQIIGINVNQMIRRAFALGGLFAGAAAFVFALYYGRPFGSHGAQSGLFAFMAALLGGVGSPFGAFISALLIGSFSSISDYYLAAQWTPVLLLALLVLLFVWKPTGFRSDDAETESTSVRDSIILTAPTQGSSMNRWLIVLILALAIIPPFLHSGQVILLLVGLFILLTLGLNLALGIAGVLDLGFAASFGFAAYLTALFTSKMDIVFVILIGAIAGALFGWIKGALARRVRSDFFVVATLAFGLFIRQVIINLNFTGGMGGIGAIPAPHFLTLHLLSQIQKYYLVLAFVILLSWVSYRLILSRTGRAWVALSEDETAALSVGVNVARLRTTALVMSSLFAGIAGALYATTISFVEPDLMAFHISSIILTMVILGGAGNVTGALIGALAIIMYDKVIVPQLADWVSLIWPVAIGSVPDIRGASFFNFGIALYLTVLLRARKSKNGA